MLNLYFKDFFLLLPFFLNYSIVWVFFLRNNFLNIRINPSSKDILKHSKFLKKINYKLLLNLIIFNFFFFIFFFLSLKLDFNNFWFNHLNINNLNNNLIILILFLSFITLYIFKNIKNYNLNYSIDYVFSLINLILVIPFLYLSNNLYCFIFFLETISIIILYKFTVSRNWFNYNNKNKFKRILPKSYLNMIFFQYWANFFSSMFLFFFIFNIIFLTGSSDWNTLNILNNLKFNNNYFYKNFINIIIWISFFLGMFLKIGFTPLHLFKIEVYKGIPFISIFFYTTFYFLSFFLFFIFLLYYNINSFKYMYINIIYIIIILGLFYVISLLFDINLIKTFFAYSTIVNVLNFIIVFYILLF